MVLVLTELIVERLVEQLIEVEADNRIEETMLEEMCEQLVSEHGWMANVVLVGDGRPHLACGVWVAAQCDQACLEAPGLHVVDELEALKLHRVSLEFRLQFCCQLVGAFSQREACPRAYHGDASDITLHHFDLVGRQMLSRRETITDAALGYRDS